MKRVVLIFPDTVSITRFLLIHKVPGVDIDTTDHSLTGILTDAQIKIACEEFDAIVKLSYSVSR